MNTASRIEGLTKQAGVPLLVSQATVEHAGGESALALRAMGEFPVRGKDEPVRLFATA